MCEFMHIPSEYYKPMAGLIHQLEQDQLITTRSESGTPEGWQSLLPNDLHYAYAELIRNDSNIDGGKKDLRINQHYQGQCGLVIERIQDAVSQRRSWDFLPELELKDFNILIGNILSQLYSKIGLEEAKIKRRAQLKPDDVFYFLVETYHLRDGFRLLERRVVQIAVVAGALSGVSISAPLEFEACMVDSTIDRMDYQLRGVSLESSKGREDPR